MRIFCYFIDLIGTPNAILEFDDGLFDHQSDSDINFHFHLINHPDKELTIFACIFLTQCLGDLFDVNNI